MLSVKLAKHETIYLPNASISVGEVDSHSVKLLVHAPASIPVMRGNLLLRIDADSGRERSEAEKQWLREMQQQQRELLARHGFLNN